MGPLAVDLLGKTLKNPIMNASGTLGYGIEIEPLWNINTMGAYVTKGLSEKPHHGNKTPRVWEERYGMINSIGLQNVGVDYFFSHYFPFFEERKLPVMVNFFGFSEDEYISCARKIPSHDLIVALEMNLSCPNIKKGGISFGKDAPAVHAIVRAVREATAIPLIAKLTPEVNNIVEIARAAYEGGADGLTLINTMPAATIDTKNRNMPLKGGLSGPILKPIALRAVYECYKEIPIPIIGTGGIMNVEDALAFFMAGARAIEIGTATFVDPFTMPKIIAGLNSWLKENDCASITAITGITHD
ncbi:MAG: dihydroorotate dehydrogenase catalytic subunit [Deltaproteobacteria bacterium]|nr:dihydroorotate dehydrogenase catalytic subunit [Deltaproteobacteria bacterium]